MGMKKMFLEGTMKQLRQLIINTCCMVENTCMSCIYAELKLCDIKGTLYCPFLNCETCMMPTISNTEHTRSVLP